MTVASRFVGAGLGVLVDRVTPEPTDDVHPVARFGRVMTALEARIWADDRLHGVAYTSVGVALGALGGLAVGSTLAATTVTVAGSELRRVATDIGSLLEVGDIDGARAVLPSLVGRDPGGLDAPGIAAAVIESLAENSVDAVVAPACWAAAAGPAGAGAYRAINTMDAMVGHHSERHENFGWASARLDDVANFVPARVFAALVVLAAPQRRDEIIGAVVRDSASHPSPNAGVAEAAVAGALGVQLGGTLEYAGRVEHRPTLGRGPRPQPSDIARAVALTDRTERLLAAGLLGAGAIVAAAGW